MSHGKSAMPAFLPTAARGRATRLAYIDDAAHAVVDARHAVAERSQVLEYGYELVDLRLRHSRSELVAHQLDRVDGIYVAGGNTFVLLHALRQSGAAHIIYDRVRKGLKYLGTSAGSIVAGLSVEHALVLDDEELAPPMANYAALGIVNVSVLPHADGCYPGYPSRVIDFIIANHKGLEQLVCIKDDEALLVSGDNHWPIPSS